MVCFRCSGGTPDFTSVTYNISNIWLLDGSEWNTSDFFWIWFIPVEASWSENSHEDLNYKKKYSDSSPTILDFHKQFSIFQSSDFHEGSKELLCFRHSAGTVDFNASSSYSKWTHWMEHTHTHNKSQLFNSLSWNTSESISGCFNMCWFTFRTIIVPTVAWCLPPKHTITHRILSVFHIIETICSLLAFGNAFLCEVRKYINFMRVNWIWTSCAFASLLASWIVRIPPRNSQTYFEFMCIWTRTCFALKVLLASWISSTGVPTYDFKTDWNGNLCASTDLLNFTPASWSPLKWQLPWGSAIETMLWKFF